MKRKQLQFLSLAPLALLVFSSLGMHAGYAQSTNNDYPALPSGEWSVAFHPDISDETAPVLVYGVTSQARGGVVSSVWLENLSARTVTAVRLQWRVVADENRDAVLLQGQTPLIALPRELPADGRRTLNFPVLAFGNVVKPLVKNGSLRGAFHVYVRVSEVRFVGDVDWRRQERQA